MKQYLLAFLLALPTVCLFTACGGGDDKMSEEIDEHLSKPDDWTITEIDATHFYCNGIAYEVDGDHLNVTGIDPERFTGEAHIASRLEYRGVRYNVTTFKKEAFKKCERLTSVVIPDGVVTIEKSAFYNCVNLYSVTIPSSVATIDEEAFYYCQNLTTVTIPESVNVIGNFAFYLSKIESLYIPNSVVSIGKGSFAKCEQLKTIVVAEGNSVYDSRYNCSAIIETKTNKLVVGCKQTVIPEDATVIGAYAFYFEGLTSFTIPKWVTDVEAYAFDIFIKTITINSPALVSTNRKWGKSNNRNVFDFSAAHFIIGADITRIGDYAFQDCNIETLTIPEGVTSIGQGAFYCCGYIQSMNLPVSLTTIGDSAFYLCNRLESVVIPHGVTSIGKSAFQHCHQLTTVTIPAGVSTIEQETFRNCHTLTVVHCRRPTPPALHGEGMYSPFEPSITVYAGTLYVPYGSYDAYKNSDEYWWKSFGTILEE